MREGDSLDVHLGSYENGEYEEIFVVDVEDQYIHPKYINVSVGYDLCEYRTPIDSRRCFGSNRMRNKLHR